MANDILTVLDDEYGVDRDYRRELGGYLIVIQNSNDLVELADDGIDIRTAIPEYVDVIVEANGEKYTNSLILLNNHNLGDRHLTLTFQFVP